MLFLLVYRTLILVPDLDALVNCWLKWCDSLFSFFFIFLLVLPSQMLSEHNDEVFGVGELALMMFVDDITVLAIVVVVFLFDLVGVAWRLKRGVRDRIPSIRLLNERLRLRRIDLGLLLSPSSSSLDSLEFYIWILWVLILRLLFYLYWCIDEWLIWMNDV